MTAATREQIAVALFSLVSGASFLSPVNGASTWISTSRRLRHWTQVDSSQMPSMFLTEHEEDYRQPGRGQPPKRQPVYNIVCYARADQQDDVGGTFVNVLMDAIEKTLAPDAPGGYVVCTLGGLVDRCWIEGKPFKDPGDLDNQVLLVVPVHVLWP